MAKKTAKQLDTDIAAALMGYISVRPMYSSFSLTPTSYIAALLPPEGRTIQFKRDEEDVALQAALAYADRRNIKIENRALLEARLRRQP